MKIYSQFKARLIAALLISATACSSAFATGGKNARRNGLSD